MRRLILIFHLLGALTLKVLKWKLQWEKWGGLDGTSMRVFAYLEGFAGTLAQGKASMLGGIPRSPSVCPSRPKFYTWRTPSWGYPDTIPSFILNRWWQNSGRVGFTYIALAHTQCLHWWARTLRSSQDFQDLVGGQWRRLRTRCLWGL